MTKFPPEYNGSEFRHTQLELLASIILAILFAKGGNCGWQTGLDEENRRRAGR